jgi:hypothetical protein
MLDPFDGYSAIAIGIAAAVVGVVVLIWWWQGRRADSAIFECGSVRIAHILSGPLAGDEKI